MYSNIMRCLPDHDVMQTSLVVGRITIKLEFWLGLLKEEDGY